MSHNEEIVDTRTLTRMLDVRASTFERWASQKRIPTIQPSNKIACFQAAARTAACFIEQSTRTTSGRTTF